MNWIAVAMGGAIGACSRYAIALYFASHASRFPVATFLSNGVGCFLMGFGFVCIAQKMLLPDIWRQFLLVGLLGALTTHSTFSVEVVGLLQSNEYKLAGIYVLLTLFTCISSVALGMIVAKQIMP